MASLLPEIPPPPAADADDAADENSVELEAPGLFRLHKNGRFLRFVGTHKLPPSLDPSTGVNSKDVAIDAAAGISARLFLPPVAPHQKLPLLVYFHGGAFCLESPASPIYHRHLTALSSLTPLLAVSVDYRLAPEHPLPAAHDDSWAALRWALARPDPWLADHSDLNRVFLAGDSAGANIAHHMALRARQNPDLGVNFKGVALIHPYFWGSEPVGAESSDRGFRDQMEKIWSFVCPTASGPDDPIINPLADDALNLASLAAERVLISVAEKDVLKHRGKAYYEKLVGSGWGGKAELVETLDAEHVFHLFHPDTRQAEEKTKLLADFFNKN